MKIIALNLHLKDIENGGWNSIEACSKYPGARWIYYFTRLATLSGYDVWPTSKTITALIEKNIGPSEITLIQEGHNSWWDKLAQLGVTNTILFNLESPMYAPDFYDRLNSAALPEFKERIGFPNILSNGPIFPSYDKEDIVTAPRSPNCRHVAVLSNKNWQLLALSQPELWKSETFRQAIIRELHSKRASVLHSMILAGCVDIYGNGWQQPDIWGITHVYGKKIEQVQDKIKTLSNYYSAVCYENTDMLGYCTEKAIDAFCAGCHAEVAPSAEAVLLKVFGRRFEYKNIPAIQEEMHENELSNPFSFKFFANYLMQKVDSLS